MKIQVTLKQSGKLVKTVQAALEEGSALRIGGDLAPAGSPFPQGHALVALQGGAVVLRLAPGMDLKLSKGNTVATLAELKAKGFTVAAEGMETMRLPQGASAEVSLGGWSLHIGEAAVAAPVAAPQAAAPRAVPAGAAGGGVLAGDLLAAYRIFSETRFSTFMKVAVVSLLVHLLIMIFFSTRVIVNDPFQTAEIPERFAKFIAPVEEEPKPVEQAPAKRSEAPKEEAPVQEAAPAENAPAEGAKSDSERKAEIKEKVKKTGLLAIIGSKGSNGALRDVLSEGGLNSDLDKALDSMKGSGLGVAKTGSDLKLGGTRGGDSYGTADIGAINTGGPGRGADLGKKQATQVQSDIATGEITASGALDSAAIAAVVKSKLSGIKYCYEKELKNNPKLSGKVLVAFTIGETGDVVSYSVLNSTLGNAEAEQCMLRMIRRWKFPAPKGGQVTVEYPFIFTSNG